MPGANVAAERQQSVSGTCIHMHGAPWGQDYKKLTLRTIFNAARQSDEAEEGEHGEKEAAHICCCLWTFIVKLTPWSFNEINNLKFHFSPWVPEAFSGGITKNKIKIIKLDWSAIHPRPPFPLESDCHAFKWDYPMDIHDSSSILTRDRWWTRRVVFHRVTRRTSVLASVSEVCSLIWRATISFWLPLLTPCIPITCAEPATILSLHHFSILRVTWACQLDGQLVGMALCTLAFESEMEWQS